MKVIYNNSKEWIYICKHSIKPQGMMPLEEVEGYDYIPTLESNPELELLEVEKVDNSAKAIKARLRVFNKALKEHLKKTDTKI